MGPGWLMELIGKILEKSIDLESGERNGSAYVVDWWRWDMRSNSVRAIFSLFRSTHGHYLGMILSVVPQFAINNHISIFDDPAVSFFHCLRDSAEADAEYQ